MRQLVGVELLDGEAVQERGGGVNVAVGSYLRRGPAAARIEQSLQGA